MKHRILALSTLMLWLASSLLGHPALVPVVRAANSNWFYVSADLDGDGLINTVEQNSWCNAVGCFQTDPLDADSDDDGLTDGEEKLFESDPLSDASPGIYVLYQDHLKTKEYYPWQPYGHKMMARGDSFNPPRPDTVDQQTGHGNDLDAVVVRRGTTFYVGGPLGAMPSITKSDPTLSDLTPVQDPYNGQWQVTIPSNSTVGQYVLTLGGQSLDLFVIFDLPTPSGELTQLGIEKFLYDDNLSTDYDNSSLILGEQEYPGDNLEFLPPYYDQLDTNNYISEGWSYKFRNQQYNRYLLEEYVIPSINGQTTQKDAAAELNALADAETVFRNPHPRSDSWAVLHPGSNPRQQCNNIAGLLTAFNRASGIPARPIITDWRFSSFDASTEIWVNDEWYIYRGYNTFEMKALPDNTPQGCSAPQWPACGHHDYKTRDWWGQNQYKPWHSGGGGFSDVIVTAREDWTFKGSGYLGFSLDYRWPSWDIHSIVKNDRRLNTIHTEYWSSFGWTQEPQVQKVLNSESNDWPDPPLGGFSVSAVGTGVGNLVTTGGNDHTSAPNSVRLGQVVAEYTVDSNSNGQDDQLVLEVEVTAWQAGDYWLLGQLATTHSSLKMRASGGIVSEALAHYQLAEGTQIVRLIFDGTEISLNRADGPYLLRGLWLTDVADPDPADFAHNSLDYLEFNHTTQAYLASAFETYGATLTADYSHTAVDSNGDGRADILLITSNINIDQPGVYSVEGSLYDAQGEFISHASWTGTESSVTLRFDNVAGSVGPYTLQNLILLNDQGQTIDYAFESHTFAPLPDLTEAGLIAFEVPTAGGGLGTLEANFPATTVFSETLESGNLKFEAEVNVTAFPGDYRLEAWLVDADGDLVTWATGPTTNLSVGTHTLSVIFDGAAIQAHGVDGPYQIVAVKVIDATGGTFNVRDTVDVALTTQAYTLNQFTAEASGLDFEDFMENGAGQWTNQAPWSIVETAYFTAHAGDDANHAWYGTNANASLTLATPLDFSGLNSPALRFQSSHRFSTNGDTGYVEASTDGSSWNTLVTLSDEAYWSTQLVDLSAYIGEPTVYLRFRLESTGGAPDDGWYIDNVRIVALPPSGNIYLPVIVSNSN